MPRVCCVIRPMKIVFIVLIFLTPKIGGTSSETTAPDRWRNSVVMNVQ